MKIFLTIILVLISILSLVSELDNGALKIYDETFDRAIYSFALAKGLNAVISVLQSSEVNLSFFVGATIGIGQILDPINDLVERFSAIMLLSSISLGVQHLLLIISKSVFVKILLIVFSVVSVLFIWIQKFHTSYALKMSMKLVLVLLVLRFGAVLFIYSNELLYNEVYAGEYNTSKDFIYGYKSNLESLQQDQKRLAASLNKLESTSETFSNKVIKLITIFVVTTILFPLLFVWLFIFIIKLIYNKEVDYAIILGLNQKEIK
ncbi:MAG: hypothetical protein H8E76_08900 [Helicobacteraceae bacterium]|nr:hypothetical protein [Candidatus Sulfurimonas ponti]MBL6973482.1 hypothetical protein [Sulfurimonas sp.]